ncbi:hypothetical protein [Plantactinospora sp. WMMB782]|uniref:hypothetical protein n=1 Tax=Plantactinospora sp. WMMB782 TaxID=3404121 RepID=UPI003B93EF79
MGEKIARISTSLTIKQCAGVFESAPRALMSGAAKLQGIIARVSGGVYTADFFTPRDEGPFSALDEDPPAFTVGTFIRNGASAPNPTAVHMYVWDRGARREVVVVAMHGFVTGAVHARKIVAGVADMLKQQDSQARVVFDA